MRYALAYDCIQAASGKDAFFATPSESLSTKVSCDSCKSATALLVCLVVLGDQAGAEWPRGTWTEVDNLGT